MMTGPITTDMILGWFATDDSGELPIVIQGHGRKSLAEFYQYLGFSRGAEIGVRRGEHAEMLCQTVPGLELLCVDPWEPQDEYLEKTNTPGKMSAFYAAAQERLEPYNCVFVKHPSIVGAKLVPDYSLDFVYIDANHRAEFVRQDLETWGPKVKRGGILGGHDYMNRQELHIEVKDAVQAFTKDRDIHPWFVLDGVKGDGSRSYFWVVE